MADQEAVAQPAVGTPFSGRTAWARSIEAPLRDFLRTETGSAAFLLAATLAALAWVNVDAASYDTVWRTAITIRIGHTGVSQDLRHWVSNGLMTFFFFVVGLEARRELDLGELRDRRRLTLPALAGFGGMLVPILVFLAFNAGRSTAHGWGAAMSTDTAFAIGMLALVGPQLSERLRAFVLTVAVTDDLLALVVITLAYTEHLTPRALFTAIGIFLLVVLCMMAGVRSGFVFFLLGLATWTALYESGVDPVVIGLAMGLLTYAAPANRDELQRATDLFRLFREQPTPELARSAQIGLAAALSPNERLQQRYHPWTSYVIVPLFALSNAGIVIDGGFLAHAYTSRVTLGIMLGYVVGKPIGISGTAWVVSKLSRGRVRLPVGWAAALGAGTIAGIGFTVSLLIAGLAFHGAELEEAKLGVLSAALLASVLTWGIFQVTNRLPKHAKIRALVGRSSEIIDLALAVDPERDRFRGPLDAPVTVVEYGDFQCPYCGQAEPVVRSLLRDFGDVRYVWRHLPLTDVHPLAMLAAEAAEGAAAQGRFWEMHDLLLDHQEDLRIADLIRYAEQLGLDVDRFRKDVRSMAGASRIAEDVEGADLSGVTGTPTFFINGLRHYGAYDIATLSSAVRAARARAYLGT